MSDLSALLIDFKDSDMKNSEKLYEIIEKLCNKLNIDIFIDTEVVTGIKKDYLFVGIEFKKNYGKDLINRFLRSLKIRIETSKIINISEVKLFGD